jgi:hypothetical protein
MLQRFDVITVFMLLLQLLLPCCIMLQQFAAQHK